MIINFDEYKDGEPITIIENEILKTYTRPKTFLSYVKCFPLTNRISLDVVGEDVIYDELKNKLDNKLKKMGKFNKE